MNQRKKRIALLGSTGSIGTQTLDVIDRLRKAEWEFEVVGLAAGASIDLLIEQVERYRPRIVSIAAEADADRLRRRLPGGIEILHGADGLLRLAECEDVDVLVNAVYGAAGLPPTLAALSLGKTVALANKESIVIGGDLIRRLLADHGGTLLSIDSEHHALHQCLHGHDRGDVHRLILTASGGPFLHTDPKDLATVAPNDALKHPTWAMGRRITIDSATLVNKAFEVVVAHHLYDVPYDRIDVVVHPDSYVHSLVEFREGSIKAELGPRDMRIPIQNLLIDPNRVDTGLPRLRLDEALQLSFLPFVESRFPAFSTVIAAAREGGSALAAVNAADEVLVFRFLDGEIRFTGIAAGLEAILERWRAEKKDEPEDRCRDLRRLLDIDRWARQVARELALQPPQASGEEGARLG
jgi:1-deoxy-D-xylulose-5-phosphate reductoisomerase